MAGERAQRDLRELARVAALPSARRLLARHTQRARARPPEKTPWERRRQRWAIREARAASARMCAGVVAVVADAGEAILGNSSVQGIVCGPNLGDTRPNRSIPGPSPRLVEPRVWPILPTTWHLVGRAPSRGTRWNEPDGNDFNTGADISEIKSALNVGGGGVFERGRRRRRDSDVSDDIDEDYIDGWSTVSTRPESAS